MSFERDTKAVDDWYDQAFMAAFCTMERTGETFEQIECRLMDELRQRQAKVFNTYYPPRWRQQSA